MAIRILENMALFHDIPHDMESFYWVLVWIILRHTEHDHKDGARACSTYFKYTSDAEAAAGKLLWLYHTSPVHIKDNRPLTRLLIDLHELVRTSVLGGGAPLTHDAMLAVFNKALQREEWPAEDAALEFKLPGPAVPSVVEVRLNTVAPDVKPEILEDQVEEEADSAPDCVLPLDADSKGLSKRRRPEDHNSDSPRPKKKSKSVQGPTRQLPPRKAKEKAALARAAYPRGSSDQQKPTPTRQQTRRKG